MSSRSIRSVRDLAERVSENEQLAQEIQQSPVEALNRIAGESGPSTTGYNIGVVFLGLVAFIGMAGTVLLAILNPNVTMPATVVSLASTALGALAALFVGKQE